MSLVILLALAVVLCPAMGLAVEWLWLLVAGWLVPERAASRVHRLEKGQGVRVGQVEVRVIEIRGARVTVEVVTQGQRVERLDVERDERCDLQGINR